MRTVVVAAGLGLALAATGCTFPEPSVPSSGSEGALTARGVTVRLPAGGGELLARARELSLEPGGAAFVLAGDASIAFDAGATFEARAERIALDADTSTALLEGRVRARLTPDVPRTRKGDAGAER